MKLKSPLAPAFPLLLLPCCVLTHATNAIQKPLVLTHVTVIDTTGGPARSDNTVIIRGDRIVEVGKSGQIHVAPDSQIVNVTGKFLIPGLWDMNVLFYEKDYLPLLIANGITGVRQKIAYAEHYEWKKEIAAGRLLGPHMAVGTRWIEGPEQIDPFFIPIANEAEARQEVMRAQKYGADFIEIGGAESLPRTAFFAIADEAKKRGIPFEGHVPVSVTPEEASNAGQRSIDPRSQIFDVDVETLAACSRREVELLKAWQQALAIFLASGHADDPLWSIEGSRERMQLTLDTYDPEKAQSLFALLRANHTWLCPTLIAEHNFVSFDDPYVAADPRLKYMSAGERNWFSGERDRLSKTKGKEDRAVLTSVYHKYVETIGAMRRAGVEFLAGTDTEEPYFTIPGFSLHEELVLLVQAGFTPLEALQTATLNPARFLGKEQEFGSIAPEKVADLVLLDANPLEDIGNTRRIAAVVYGGKLYPRASLDAMLASIEKLASKKSIGDAVEEIIKEKGVEAAIRRYRELKSTQSESFDFEDRGELSDLGMRLLREKKFKDAIQIFTLNAEAFPRYWWVYEDLGDAYMEAGDKELAAKNFEHSLQLDPAQTYAAIKLKQLNSQ